MSALLLLLLLLSDCQYMCNRQRRGYGIGECCVGVFFEIKSGKDRLLVKSNPVIDGSTLKNSRISPKNAPNELLFSNISQYSAHEEGAPSAAVIFAADM